MIMNNKPASLAEHDRPLVTVFPEARPVHLPGQLELFDAHGRLHVNENDSTADEVIDDAA
jgi:hypothetical protein